MKLPKTTKKYCPYCKKHTEHKITIERTRARPKTKKRGLSWGTRHMAKISSGYVGFPRPIPRDKAKTSRKANLKFECFVCKKKHFQQNPIRLKKVEQA
jgi:large subunit ribosomal protein L44e